MGYDFKLIGYTSLSSSSNNVQFTSIPSTYTDLFLYVSARSSRTSFGDIVIRFNNDTTNYTTVRFFGSGVGTGANDNDWTNISSSGQTSNIFSNIAIYIPEYAGSAYKNWSIDNIAEDFASIAYQTIAGGYWASTSAITTITLTDVSDSSSNSFIANSTFSLYGITKA